MSIAIGGAGYGVQCQTRREYTRRDARKDTCSKPRSSFCNA
jgi:hypothetical protein